VLGTRFGSIELKMGSLDSEKIISGFLESEKSGLYRSVRAVKFMIVVLHGISEMIIINRRVDCLHCTYVV